MQSWGNLKQASVVRDGDVFTVNLELPDGVGLFRFENPVYAKNDLEATLISSIIFPGVPERDFESRINVYSNSSKESYARQLTSAFGKEISWPLILSQICAAFSKSFKQALTEDFLNVNQISGSANTNYLLHPFIEENSPNIFFGKGGSGKTFITLRMAMSLACGDSFLSSVPTKSVKTAFLDYESTKEVFKSRIEMMRPFCKSFTDKHNENLFYYPAKGIPLHELRDTLQRLIKDNGIEFLIIDSAALACGGAPEDAQNAIRFFNALSTFKITSLTIAHETKAENNQYVFGSIFFHNSARNIWNVKNDQDQDEDVIHVGLMHRKCNNGRLQKPQSARIYFGQNSIDINSESVSRWAKELSMKGRIIELLREGPKTFNEICDEIDDKDKSIIKSRLQELKKKEKIENIAEKWHFRHLVTPPSTEMVQIEDMFGGNSPPLPEA